MQGLKVLIAAILFGAGCAHAAQAPRIEGKGRAAALVVPAAVQRAIAKAAPGFRAWQMNDYIAWVREDYAKPDSAALPFAVIADVNNDGIDDLVVDGHAGTEAMTLAVLSSPRGYAAQVAERYPLRRPGANKAYDEHGKAYTGFWNWLEFNPDLKHDDTSYAYSRAIMQVLDSDGTPANDGGIVLYHLRKGKFVTECPGEAC